MGDRKVVSTEAAPRAIGPYSQAVEAQGFLFLSGQIALVPAQGQLRAGTVEDETRQCLENLAAVLAARGLGLEDVVKTTLYLLRMEDFEAVNRIYGEFFAVSPPARATVAVAGLPRGARVEIEAIARIPA